MAGLAREDHFLQSKKLESVSDFAIAVIIVITEAGPSLNVSMCQIHEVSHSLHSTVLLGAVE